MADDLFGQTGVRGRANRWPMDTETVLKLGMAAGSIFAQGGHRHRVVIGKDTRLSGYMIEQALTAGFPAVGMDVFLLGPLPTPAVAMLTRSLRADLGVMISASQIPSRTTASSCSGRTATSSPTRSRREIEALIDGEIAQALAEPARARPRKAHRRCAGALHRIRQAHLPKELTLEGMRIVIDCANGAAYKVAPEALWELGAEVITIGVEPDGFNINDELRLDRSRGDVRQGQGNARRYRHRARRRCRPRDHRR